MKHAREATYQNFVPFSLQQGPQFLYSAVPLYMAHERKNSLLGILPCSLSRSITGDTGRLISRQHLYRDAVRNGQLPR